MIIFKKYLFNKVVFFFFYFLALYLYLDKQNLLKFVLDFLQLLYLDFYKIQDPYSNLFDMDNCLSISYSTRLTLMVFI